MNQNNKNNQKNRIWELDFVRGIAILLMAFDHLTYDIAFLLPSLWENARQDLLLGTMIEYAYSYRASNFSYVFRIICISGVFLFISGISSNLSKNNFKRGLKLFGVAMMLSLVTLGLSIEFSKSIIIYFGILHCLSVAMMISPLLRKLPDFVLAVLGTLIIGFGFYLEFLYLNGPIILIPFNITPKYFQTADYYPLIPYMGFYILGFVFGRTFYQLKTSIYRLNLSIRPINFLGRNALFIYFFHQILLVAFVFIIGWIFTTLI